MKGDHYEFSPSTTDDGEGQYFLFNVCRSNDAGDISVRLSRKQVEQMRENRRLLSQAAAQRRSPEAQPSIPRLPLRRAISAFAVRTHTREI